MSVFYYLFASQCSSNSWGFRNNPEKTKKLIRTCEADISWEDARYLIERKSGLHQPLTTHSHPTSQYFEGRLWKDGIRNWRKETTTIPGNYMMKPGDRVIILARPLPHGMKPFVPLKFRADVVLNSSSDTVVVENNNKSSEQLRFEMICETEQQKSSCTLIQRLPANKNLPTSSPNRMVNNLGHASELFFYVDRLVPPPSYVCHRCHHKGHFKNKCITQFDPTFTPMQNRRPPTGIPRTFLKPIKNIRGKSAFYVGNGDYMVWREPIQPRT